MHYKYLYIYNGNIYYSWQDLLQHSDYGIVKGHYYATGILNSPRVEKVNAPKLISILKGLDDVDDLSIELDLETGLESK